MTNHTHNLTSELIRRRNRAEAACRAAHTLHERAEALGENSLETLLQAADAAISFSQADRALARHLAGMPAEELYDRPMTPAEEIEAVVAILDEHGITGELRAEVLAHVEALARG